jgi:type III restriction enzyme
MSNPFFEKPILNSPYEYPNRHWELDESGQPTQKVIGRRREASFITPIPKPRKRKGQAEQMALFVNELSTQKQEYDHTALINAVRREKVPAYVKNHNLGLEAPYRYASETRK